jgi:hypothetical protein
MGRTYEAVLLGHSTDVSTGMIPPIYCANEASEQNDTNGPHEKRRCHCWQSHLNVVRTVN